MNTQIHYEFVFIFLTFWGLVAWTLASRTRREGALTRSRAQWILDIVGLLEHGFLVPMAQRLIVFAGLSYFLPHWKGSFNISDLSAFCINFFLVDYAYYWNHRIFHNRIFWRFHSVHHSGTGFDVFTTSRNSFLTTFLTLYVWVDGVFLYLLANATGYVWGIVITNCLDLMRHSSINKKWSIFPFCYFISPVEHASHHAADSRDVNFGGNLNLWDKLHGTYVPVEKNPERFGEAIEDKNMLGVYIKGMP